MKKSAFGFVIFCGILVASACVIPVYFPEPGDFPVRTGEFHRVVALAAEGTVSLENAAGDIDIRGWEKNEVEILAEEAWGWTFARRFWFLGSRRSGPKVDIDKIDNFLKIKTHALNRDIEEEAPAIHYTLNVPHSINLKDIRAKSGRIRIADLYGKVRVDLEEGDIKVENFSGSLDISLVRGSAEVELLDMRKEDDIKITVKRGDITLFLQPDVMAKIEASAANGTVSGDFDLGQPLPAKKVTAQIGKPEGTALSLTALSGNIRLKKIKE
jgi:hypothetical protein